MPGHKSMSITLGVFDYDVDKKVLIGPAAYAAQFAKDVREHADNFGLLVDLSHLPQTYESPKYAIQTMKPYITHFHLGNCVMKDGADAYGDTHPRFGFPNGVSDVNEVREFLQAMREEGFFTEENPHIVSFEVKPREDEDPGNHHCKCKTNIEQSLGIVLNCAYRQKSNAEND